MKERPKPFVFPEFCKGCGRCITACAHHCIEMGASIDPRTGLVPIELHLEECTGCGLCIDACPEPYGLLARPEGLGLEEPVPPPWLPASRSARAARAASLPDEELPLPSGAPPMLVTKGTYAAAIGALLAGCRHFFGYPITPSTEGAELMARLLPKLGGSFVQAVSEVAAINMIYGCGGAGRRALTFTSSPGFSLMLEGLSYMVGAEVPGVIVNCPPVALTWTVWPGPDTSTGLAAPLGVKGTPVPLPVMATAPTSPPSATRTVSAAVGVSTAPG